MSIGRLRLPPASGTKLLLLLTVLLVAVMMHSGCAIAAQAAGGGGGAWSRMLRAGFLSSMHVPIKFLTNYSLRSII
uniref:Uncharacterized protein n=1 Tax=Oryza glaberrima TaxID=4538 RepID=I1QYU5_ORYGL